MPKLESLVQDFARRQGIEPPLPDDRGVFEVVFEADSPVRCFEWFESLNLVSPLAMLPGPPVQRREWLKRLMNYALHRMKDNRSTPVLSDDGSVTLFARLNLAGLSVDEFEAGIEEQLNSVDSYRKVLGAVAMPVSPVTLPRSIVRP